MPTASMSPASFVRNVLWRLPVSQQGGPTVRLAAYVCGNGKNDVNAKVMRAALVAAAQKNRFTLPPKDARNQHLFETLFTGQGSPLAFWQMFMTTCLWKNDIKAYGARTGKPGPFENIIGDERPDHQIIQDLIDRKYFGMDCIGFVGRYLEAAGVLSAYMGLYPRQYLDMFTPVRSLAELDDLCVLVWADGSHIAIVDQVLRRTTQQGVVTEVVVCQSANDGPIVNERARIVEASAQSVLDIAAYNKALAALEAQRSRKEIKTHDEFESKRQALIKSLRTQTSTVGYRGGRLFHFGPPKAGYPSGTVYIGRMANLEKRYTS